MRKRLIIPVALLALLLFGSSAALAEENWAIKDVHVFVDDFLKKMDPTETTMEAQVTAMDRVSKKRSTDIQREFRLLILYRTIAHAADDVANLAPASRHKDVSDKMELVRFIADGHYSSGREHVEWMLKTVLVDKRSNFEGTKDGAHVLKVFQQLQDAMEDLDSEIEATYMKSKFRPKTFREI